MVRAAAKNFASVGMVVSPDRYDDVLGELRRDGGLSAETRRGPGRRGVRAHGRLRRRGRRVVRRGARTRSRRSWGSRSRRWPSSATARTRTSGGPCTRRRRAPGLLGGAQVLAQGKQMSFNNWLDVEPRSGSRRAPRGRVRDREAQQPVRRGRASRRRRRLPAGLRLRHRLGVRRHRRVQRRVDGAAAGAMAEVFTEVVIAPAFTDEALATLAARKKPARRAGAAARERADSRCARSAEARWSRTATVHPGARADWRSSPPGSRPRSSGRDLLFAWTVAARVKSNAIVFAQDGATVGVGAGQMSRVDSVVARRAQGRGPGPGRRHGERRVLPVPRRRRGRRRRRRDGGDPSGGLGPRRGGARRSPSAGGWRSSSPGRRHFRH